MIGLHDILAKSYTHAKEAWGWNSQLFRRSPTPNQCAGLRAPAWVGFHRYGPMSQTPSQWHGSLLPVPSPKVSHRKLPKKTCSRTSACMIIINFCWLAQPVVCCVLSKTSSGYVFGTRHAPMRKPSRRRHTCLRSRRIPASTLDGPLPGRGMHCEGSQYATQKYTAAAEHTRKSVPDYREH